MGRLIPGDYLRTALYRILIKRPRAGIRSALHSFYRIDHVYDVIEQAKRRYQGKFSILEFGTADGYAFTKMLYAVKYLGMEDRITVHGFDTFEGMPPAADARDHDLITGDGWVEGEFHGRLEELTRHCRERYHNFRLHRGFFEETLTDEFLRSLEEELPILVWIDCDYYSSARSVIERLLPHLPNGCVVYFDDYDLNFGSRFTGEARVIDEVNRGLLGADMELVPDRQLSLESNRVYRFVRLDNPIRFEKRLRKHNRHRLRRRTTDSALP